MRKIFTAILFLGILAAYSSCGYCHVGTHITNDQWDKVQCLQELNPAMVRVGLQPFDFHRWNRTADSFDWSETDAIMQANDGRTIMLNVSPHYKRAEGFEAVPRTEEEIERFLEFVAILCDRYGDKIGYWQLENEVTSLDNWPLEDYPIFADLLQRFHDLIKARFPDAKICWGIETAWQSYRRARLTLIPLLSSESYDAIDIHYHTTWEDDELALRVQQLKKMTGKEILSTESSTWSGAPENMSSQSEEQQAWHFVRSTFASLGAGASSILYGIISDRPDWQGPNRFKSHGQFRADDTPKVIVQAFYIMNELLEETAAVAPTKPFGRPIQRFKVDGPEHHFDVVWWQGDTEVKHVRFGIDEQLDEITVVDAITGQLRVVPVRDGQIALRLQRLVPVYLIRQ